jgi:hypothetical protein
MELFVEIAGWFGAVCVLGAYVLLTTKRVRGDSLIFQTMNVAGSAGFIVNTAWHGAIPSVVLNIVWCCVGIVAIVQIMLASRKA